ncbi:exonuclease SbcD [Lachnospiraceae bacterium KM106-2]|nr:exonuclease SbcD [Lachnospiraceae bacterium KM106-2]
MKFIHTGDLHIGKQVHEFSMLEDQKYILDEIVNIAKEEEADAILLAGDVYDRSVPPAEAVSLLDDFLSKLTESGKKVFLISGNHDSPERLSFASEILEREGVYITGLLPDQMKEIVMKDEFGPIHVYLMPFAKPQVIRQVMTKSSEGKIPSYEESIRNYIGQTIVKEEERNLLMTHHFITNQGVEPEQSDSESLISVGGTDNIDVSTFDAFDYVALGHIHRAQKVGRDTVRYSGSPLKYSFSEVFHKKSVCVIEMKEKGNVEVRLRELNPIRDMRKIKGTLEDLVSSEVVSAGNANDYIEATLTDKEELIDPISRLRASYPNIMHLRMEQRERKEEGITEAKEAIKKMSPLEIFEEFYEKVSGREFTEEKREIMVPIIDEAVSYYHGSEKKTEGGDK